MTRSNLLRTYIQPLKSFAKRKKEKEKVTKPKCENNGNNDAFKSADQDFAIQTKEQSKKDYAREAVTECLRNIWQT